MSIAYYLEKLGFSLDWRVPYMASVSRDKGSVMLCEGHQGNPGTWVWFGVEDARGLFAEYSESGARIRLAPVNYEWALEMQVWDLDGHVLRFGSEPLDDLPFSEWVEVAEP